MFRSFNDEMRSVITVTSPKKVRAPALDRLVTQPAPPRPWRAEFLLFLFCLTLVWLGTVVSQREVAVARVSASQRALQQFRASQELEGVGLRRGLNGG